MADWDRALREYGVKCAVVIARDNATRDTINDQARQLHAAAGHLGREALTFADRDFRTGDRVIARRNDRGRDVDNGTLGTVVAIDLDRLSLTVETDSGELRPLDVAYVADHLEHAYALTGHGAQGATVDWAAVVGRPSELTREWAYTALSRAREKTRIHLISESSRRDQDRARYAPEPTPPGPEHSLKSLAVSMRQPAVVSSLVAVLAQCACSPLPTSASSPKAGTHVAAQIVECGERNAPMSSDPYPCTALGERDAIERRPPDRCRRRTARRRPMSPRCARNMRTRLMRIGPPRPH